MTGKVIVETRVSEAVKDERESCIALASFG